MKLTKLVCLCFGFLISEHAFSNINAISESSQKEIMYIVKQDWGHAMVLH